MKHVIPTILIVLTVGGVALGQARSARPVEKPIPDICKGVIDPYDISGEKTLFYAAAGVDNELSSDEFNASKGKDKTFVRKFDSWKTLVTFDKDKNGKTDSNEVGAYRLETPRKVMGSVDANEDCKLSGQELTASNKALASRTPSLSPLLVPRATLLAQCHAERSTDKATDIDGKLNKSEEDARKKAEDARRQAWEQARREAEERYRKEREMEEHDANKDGKLDQKEAAARDADRADRDRRRKEFTQKWDKNGDGRITGEEWREAGPALRTAIQDYYTNKFDKNKDGELDKDEKSAMESAMRKERDRRREEGRNRYEMQRYDRNRDGKLDKAETAERDKGRAERSKRIADYIKKYDKNGDGRVDEKERPQRSGGDRGRGRGGPGRGGDGRGGSRD